MADGLFTAEWFPWHFRRIAGSDRVADMSLAEEGAYRRMIDYLWQHGSISSEPKIAAERIGKRCTAKIAEKCLALCVPSPDKDGRMVHETVEMIRSEQYDKYLTKVRGGKASAAKRGKQTTSNTTPTELEHNSSSVRTKKEKRREEDLEEKSKNGVPPVAAVAAVVDDPVESRIWKEGLELLIKSGEKEKSARTLLGKLAKQYGKQLLAESIAATQSEHAADPKTFLIGVLRERSGGNNGRLYVGKHSDEPIREHVPTICRKCRRDVCLGGQVCDELHAKLNQEAQTV